MTYRQPFESNYHSISSRGFWTWILFFAVGVAVLAAMSGCGEREREIAVTRKYTSKTTKCHWRERDLIIEQKGARGGPDFGIALCDDGTVRWHFLETESDYESLNKWMADGRYKP